MSKLFKRSDKARQNSIKTEQEKNTPRTPAAAENGGGERRGHKHFEGERARHDHNGSRKIGMSVKLFGFLVAFTMIILVVVWILQIGLLNYFYEQTKYDEFEHTEHAILNSLERTPDSLANTVELYSKEYLMCIRVFRLDGKVASEISNVDALPGCIIHHVSKYTVSWFYSQAVDNGGVYVEEYMAGRGDERHNSHIDIFNENKDERENAPEKESINAVYVRLAEDRAGNDYIIMLNSELAPLSSTVQMLKTQFWMIATILLVCSLILSYIISKNISRPIVEMNRAAKGLAHGNYNTDFGAHGYREVIELSDTLSDVSEELSKNDRLQKELLANISHDLRTPLTMIKGYGEVMRDIPGENTPENIQVIIDETQRLGELVNDLLDLSKLQAGSIKPNMAVLDLGELICSTLTRYEKLTRHDGYNIEYRFGAGVRVMADKTMLLQVIYNLINNAVNYTGEDKYVYVRQTLKDGGRRVRISVTDTGAGIPKEDIPYIWDRYYKVDKVHRRAMVGTGLGLSIVKNILLRHGATYGVESEMGKGSTFWFEMDVFECDRDTTCDNAIDAEYLDKNND